MWRPAQVAALLVAALLVGLLGPSRAGADPAFDYLLHCGGCHLENGAGDPPRVPDLREHLDHFASFSEGRAYLVRVPGSAQAPLSDEALAAVLNWLLERLYEGRQYTRFSGVEVSAYRSQPLLDPLARRAELLDAVQR